MSNASLATSREKKAFIELLQTLPHKGEFFTDEGVKQAAPYTRVLLSLDEADIAEYDLYPFLALSRGLVELDEPRRYAQQHFSTIAHPTMKLTWAMLLFDANTASPEIVGYLHSALSGEQRKTIAEMTGPMFEQFERRVMATPIGQD